MGDFISGGGVTGTVREIGLFATTIDQPDNVLPPSATTSCSPTTSELQRQPVPPVDLFAQIAHGVDPQQAMALIRARIVQIPNVPNPAPDVEIPRVQRRWH